MEKPLKIAVVVGVFPGVSETFIVNQLAYLKKNGHTLTILCTRHIIKNHVTSSPLEYYGLMGDALEFSWPKLMPLNKIKRFFTALVILFKSVGSNTFIKFVGSLNVLKYGKKAMNLNQFFKIYYHYFFAINNFDVVHIHFGDNAVHLQEQLKRHRKKIVVSFHGYDANNYNKKFYENLSGLNNVQFTVNTQFTKENILKLGFRENKVSILPVGLDTSFFSSDDKKHPPNKFDVIFVGRLIQIKAPIIAIKIIKKLKEKGYNDIYLTIVGDGDEYNHCKQFIAKHHLSDHTALTGSKSQEEIKELMNLSDVFLFPGIKDENNRCESQGLVIQEAQAMKLPVIISDVGGMKEGMIDNETGFVVAENNVDLFAEKIEFLFKNPTIRSEMGEKARSFVVKNYDNSFLGEKLIRSYNL